jgi:hypothetical protein
LTDWQLSGAVPNALLHGNVKGYVADQSFLGVPAPYDCANNLNYAQASLVSPFPNPILFRHILFDVRRWPR